MEYKLILNYLDKVCHQYITQLKIKIIQLNIYKRNNNTSNNYFLKTKDDNFETPFGFFVLLAESMLSVLSFKSDFLFLILSVFYKKNY